MTPALLLVATLVVVGLLIAVIVRMGTRFDAVRADLERLRVVQRDTSSDVRARLEEGSRGWEALETDVRPRLEQVEAAAADLGATLAENLPALIEAREHAEAARERLAASEARIDRALEAVGQEGGERMARIEAAVRTLRDAADERLHELTARVSALEAENAYEPDDEPVLEAVGAAEAPAERTAAAGRGTGRAHESRGSRWIVVMLVVAAGAALAMATLN